MKKLCILLCLALLLCGCAVSAPAPEPTEAPAATAAPTTPPAMVSEPAEAPADTPEPAYSGPQFTADSIGGGSVDQSYIQGNRLTMINFWATWCGPCVSEMPDLAKLHTAYADKGLGILGVMVDDNEAGAMDLIGSAGIGYPIVTLTAELASLAGDLQAVPTTVFIDAYGRQVGEVQIGSRSYADWASLVDELLSTLS